MAQYSDKRAATVKALVDALHFNPGGDPKTEWRKALAAKKNAIELYDSAVIVFGETSKDALERYYVVGACAAHCVYWFKAVVTQETVSP